MKKVFTIVGLMVFLLACNDTTDDMGDNPNGNQDPPEGVQLVFPHEDSLCNEGENPTPTESTVYFEWEPNDNAESYTITIESLDSENTIQLETSEFIYPVTIPRAEAFSWSVTYQYQGETKESTIWNFYNAGPGIQTYAPFPAEIISPVMAETFTGVTSITLQWNGSDVDIDIIAYDVYFGTSNPPNLNTNDISANQLTVSVASGNIYYWKIVTKDAQGNTSESATHQFEVF